MPTPSKNLPVLGLAAVIVSASAIPACESGPAPKAVEVRVVSREVPSVLRNTVGAEASLSGDEPIVMTGYGLVVGLNGTGSNDVPLAIRTAMIDQMTRMGVGKERGSMPGVSPDALLDDPNVAVAFVQAVIPPGAPKGFTFDVRVDAVPGSSTKSLEGGTLWTTELRRGIAAAGGPATPAMARVYGPIFTNPFAGPGGEGIEPTEQRTGFVLSGGTLTNPWPLTLVLDNPSHSRARAIVAAINARFGREVSRGRSEDAIAVTIPAEYRGRPGIFTSLLKHMRIDQAFPEEAARRYTDALREQPELANELSWCLAALGEPAIPFARRLYNDAEIRPRLAALQAGARLGDLTAAPHLQALISAGPSPTRAQMIDLLSDLPADPKVSVFLRELLDAPELDARVAAYEALEKRKDPFVRKTMIAGKFELHIVPCDDPMIYITQSKSARIVLFGSDIALNRPTLVAAWDGRLMLDAPATGPKARVYYKSDRPGVSPVTAEVDPSLTALIDLFAAKPGADNPTPGLDLTYSQTVGALYQVVTLGAISAPIVPEQDKIALEMLRARRGELAEERPELSDSGAVEALAPSPDAVRAAAPAPLPDGSGEGVGIVPPARPLDEARAKQRQKYVVPLAPSEAEQKKAGRK